MSKFLSTKELAERWGFAEGTLENWRQKKFGPKYLKFGEHDNAKVKYPLNEIERYEKKHFPKVSNDG